MHATRLALPLLVLSLGLAACGGGGDDEPSYPADVKERFLAACSKSSKGKDEICRCTFSKIEDTVPFAEFNKADKALSGGGRADPATAEKLNAALKACT